MRLLKILNGRKVNIMIGFFSLSLAEGLKRQRRQDGDDDNEVEEEEKKHLSYGRTYSTEIT